MYGTFRILYRTDVANQAYLKQPISQGFQCLLFTCVSKVTSVTASLVLGSSQLILSQSSAERLRFAAKNSPINARTAPSLYCVAFCARLPSAESAS